MSSYRYTFYSILFIFIYNLIFWLFSGFNGVSEKLISVDNFFILLYLSAINAFIFFLKSDLKAETSKVVISIFKLLLYYNLIQFCVGISKAETYLDWKNLIVNPQGGLALFSPIIMVIGIHYYQCRRIYNFLLKTFKYGLLIIPFQLANMLPASDSYSRIMQSVNFFLLLAPYVKRKNQLWIITISILSLFLALDWRTNGLRLMLLLTLTFSYPLIKGLSRRVTSVLCLCALLLPIYFLLQGIFEGISVFESNNTENTFYITGNSNDDNLLKDTRTFLYKEVLSDLYFTNDIFFGRGAIGKYNSILIDSGDEKGRLSVEVGFLKILVVGGIVGFFLNTMILFLGIYYSLKKSNNTLSKIIGIFLSIHWILLFIENMPFYDLYYFLLWFSLGVCLSKRFRHLSDQEIKDYFLIKS